jgi:hypothetical protein
MLSRKTGLWDMISATGPGKIVTAQHNDYTGQKNGTKDQESPIKFHKRCLYTPSAAFHHALYVPPHRAHPTMTARIFKPAKTAMQSGTAQTREWQLDYEPEQPQVIEPLMGWTSSGDMKQQLSLHFETKEEAVAYCEREGIPYQVFEPKEPAYRQAAYADNFAFRRSEPWTH